MKRTILFIVFHIERKIFFFLPHLFILLKNAKILHMKIRNPAFKISADPWPGLDLNADIFDSRKICTYTRYQHTTYLYQTRY
jgi:hypothetical protein